MKWEKDRIDSPFPLPVTPFRQGEPTNRRCDIKATVNVADLIENMSFGITMIIGYRLPEVSDYQIKKVRFITLDLFSMCDENELKEKQISREEVIAFFNNINVEVDSLTFETFHISRMRISNRKQDLSLSLEAREARASKL